MKAFDCNMYDKKTILYVHGMKKYNIFKYNIIYYAVKFSFYYVRNFA